MYAYSVKYKKEKKNSSNEFKEKEQNERKKLTTRTALYKFQMLQ